MWGLCWPWLARMAACALWCAAVSGCLGFRYSKSDPVFGEGGPALADAELSKRPSVIVQYEYWTSDSEARAKWATVGGRVNQPEGLIPHLDGVFELYTVDAALGAPPELLLEAEYHCGALSPPWWTQIQVIDFFAHTLALPTAANVFFDRGEFRIRDMQYRLVHSWHYTAEQRYFGNLWYLFYKRNACRGEELMDVLLERVGEDLRGVAATQGD